MAEDFVVSGMLNCGDGYRCDDDESNHGAIFVGNTDLIEEIYERFSGEVDVLVNGEVIASGLSTVELGWGYSEYTPCEGDAWRLDGDDIVGRLLDLCGQHVEIRVRPKAD